jgi:6-phosphogluconolactonase
MTAVRIRGAEVVTLADEAAVAHESAARLTQALSDAIAQRGRAHLALTGGSSAVSLYRELQRPVWREGVPWPQVHLWWGDERLVPVDHPDSNTGLAYRLLLGIGARTAESGTGALPTDLSTGTVPGLPIAAENVHPFAVDALLGESDPADLIAARYAAQILSTLPAGALGLPSFDVILLGLGIDGHIMSVFPDSPLIDDPHALVAAVAAPTHIGPHLARVTLSPRLLPAAGLVLVMVTGADKADIVGDVLGAEVDPARRPAQLALTPNAVWLLDRAAAARL